MLFLCAIVGFLNNNRNEKSTWRAEKETIRSLNHIRHITAGNSSAILISWISPIYLAYFLFLLYKINITMKILKEVNVYVCIGDVVLFGRPRARITISGDRLTPRDALATLLTTLSNVPGSWLTTSWRPSVQEPSLQCLGSSGCEYKSSPTASTLSVTRILVNGLQLLKRLSL